MYINNWQVDNILEHRVENLKKWIQSFLANNEAMVLAERKRNLLIQSVRIINVAVSK